MQKYTNAAFSELNECAEQLDIITFNQVFAKQCKVIKLDLPNHFVFNKLSNKIQFCFDNSFINFVINVFRFFV